MVNLLRLVVNAEISLVNYGLVNATAEGRKNFIEYITKYIT